MIRYLVVVLSQQTCPQQAIIRIFFFCRELSFSQSLGKCLTDGGSSIAMAAATT